MAMQSVAKARVPMKRLKCCRDELGLSRIHRRTGRHEGQRAGDTPFGLAAARVSCKGVAMGEESVEQIGGVNNQQDDCDTEAQPLIGERDVRVT